MVKDHPDLYKKVLKGGFWVFALRIFTQVLSLVRLTVLARLLAPEDFGLLGIALLLIGILETFTNTGFQAALIQKKKDITPYLDSAWTLNVIRGVCLFAVLYFVTPYVVGLRVPIEQIPTTIKIVRVTGLVLVFNGLKNIGMIYFHKDLAFNKIFYLGFFSNIISITVSIVIAILYRSVWALVLGQLLSSGLGCLISYYMHPFKPRFKLDIVAVCDLWRFGKWVAVSAILGFIMRQGDDIFVWLSLGVTQLGMYQLAYKLSNLPSTEITDIANKVLFPAFSSISGDIDRLRKAYFKSLEKICYLTLPIGVIIFFTIDIYVKFLLGDKWEPIILPVKILVAYGLIKAINATTSNIYYAIGNSSIITKVLLLKLVFFSALLFPLTLKYGIVGASVAVLISAAIITPVNLFLVAKILQTNIITLCVAVSKPFALAVILFFIGIVLEYYGRLL